MNINKKIFTALIAAFIVFSVIAFCLPCNNYGTFWVTYIFDIAAFALQIVYFKSAFANSEGLKSKILGFPVFRVGYIYLSIQIAASLLIFIVNIFIAVPIQIALIVCVIICGGAVICGIGTDIAHEQVERSEIENKKDISFMTSLRSRTQAAAAINPQLSSIADAVRFSDPVSSAETAVYEVKLDKILTQIEDTRGDIDELKRVHRCAHQKERRGKDGQAHGNSDINLQIN